jgi:alkanesulfonate monooxygenase SsuD/methylene tetrahydromethanopterin reductase-like flavin-dependent oxidoreductase (luciferase family)
VAGLLRGDTVTQEGSLLTLRGARLDGLPVGGTVEIAVGGGHPEILRAAARRADVVALSGLGRTLPDGHHHEVRWSAGDLRRQLRLVRDEARRAGTAPIVEALVQAVTVTEDRASSITQLSERIAGASAEDAARTPFLLVGTYEQMAAQLLAQAEELGITSYVVREAAVPHLERVLALIRG